MYKGMPQSKRRIESHENLPILINEISNSNDPELMSGYELLQSRLPKDEIVEFNLIKSAINDKKSYFPDNYHFIVDKENLKILAIAVGYYLHSENIGFINYLVTRQGFEKKGIGLKMREQLIELFKNDAKNSGSREPRGIVGEVEENNPWLKKLAESGALILDIKYFQPSLHKDTLPTQLALYYQPIGGNKISSLNKNEIERLVYTIYRDVYEIQEPKDNLNYQEILKSIKNMAIIN